MRCVEFAPELLPDLTRLVNTQLAAMPPGWVLSEDQIVQTIASGPELWSTHYPDQAGIRFKMTTFCVLDDRGSLVAAAQWGCPVHRQSQGMECPCMLFWIVAQEDNTEGVPPLLEALTADVRVTGNQKIAPGRFSFGVGWPGIPASWSHVVTALQADGFVQSRSWVVLTSATGIRAVCKPESPASMRTSWKVEGTESEWNLRLHDDRALIGECDAWGIPRHFLDCEGYADWVTVEWLGVEPSYRRKGIGTWLVAEQFRRQVKRGIGHAMTWTETDNQPMRGLGQNLGFQGGPECLEFEKVVR